MGQGQMGLRLRRRLRTPLKEETKQLLKEIFQKMDTDGNNVITREEAIRFWGDRFGKINANNFFHEVDEDGNNSVSCDEFMAFWQHVKDKGYREEAIREELDNIFKGEAWVGFSHHVIPHAQKIDKAGSSMTTKMSSKY
mmetsp:Transcript_72427/g.224952  ORF Transcript_72427/g.224952 Transcript_72427/m.224952 type:complete len:139 (+) Transcript_72427:39-455(+)